MITNNQEHKRQIDQHIKERQDTLNSIAAWYEEVAKQKDYSSRITNITNYNEAQEIIETRELLASEQMKKENQELKAMVQQLKGEK